MKTTSNHLFLLIHSLSRNEKGYFKKQVLAHSKEVGEVQYIKLFDAIDKQPVYDENKLLEKFKKEKFITQFSVAKNYLIFLILKSMVQYHAGKNAESQLNRLLDFSHVLFMKGFYKECMTELSRAKKIAYQFDKHDYTITIIKKEKHLIASLKNKDMISDLQALLIEERKVLDILRIESELSVVYYNFLNEIHKSRIIKSEEEYVRLEKIKSSISNHSQAQYSTFNSKNYYYGIETIYNYLINNFQEARNFGLKHCTLWEKNKDRFEDENDDYLEVLYHYLSACFETKDFDTIVGCLIKLKNLETNSNDKKQRKYFIYYGLKLRYFATLAMYDEVKLLLQEIEENASEIFNDQYPSYKISLCVGCAITYFILEEYSNALRWLNVYRNNFNKEFRKDAYVFSRVLNLMTHYKLGNTDLLEHTVKNNYREMKNQAYIFEYEKIMLQFFKHVVKNKSKKNIITRAKEFQKQLTDLKKNPVEVDAMRYLNFGRWLESEIRQIPYRELAFNEVRN